MIPSNYHHVIQYAGYSFSFQNQVPDKLKLEEDLKILPLRSLPNFSIVKEYELIAQYSDWNNSQKSKKFSESKNSSPKSSDLVDFTELKNERTSLADDKSTLPNPSNKSSSAYDSNNYALPELRQSSNSPQANPAPPNSNEYLVLRMIQETGQERDICYFLLESVNWDFDEAMNIMMQNLQVK